MNQRQRFACGLAFLMCCPAALLAKKTDSPALVVQSAHSHPVTAVALSHDSAGTLTATASVDQTIKIWHTRTGQLLHTFTGHTDVVSGVAFSHDNQFLVSVSRDRHVGLWNVHTGVMENRTQGFQGKPGCLAINKDRQVAVGGEGRIIELHEFKEKSATRRDLRGHSSGISCLTFSPNGKILASGSQDQTIRLWDAASGKEMNNLKGHGHVRALAFSADGKTLASASDDKTIRLWTVDPAKKTAVEKETIKIGTQIKTLSFVGPATLVAGGEDSQIHLRDLAGGKTIVVASGQGAVHSLAVSHDGKLLVTAGHGPSGRLWTLEIEPLAAKPQRRLTGLTDRVFGIALSKDGKSLAAGMGQTIAIWRFGLATRLQILEGHVDQIDAVAFSPDGKFLASAGGEKDRAIHFWEARTGKHIHSIHAHSAEILSIAFSPDGKTLASASLDRSVNLWDVPSGKKKSTLTDPDLQPFHSVAFSPDGKYLATGTRVPLNEKLKYSGTGTPANVLIWNAQSLKVSHKLHHHDFRILSLAFSPDSKLLASGSDDGTIKLWDAATGKEKGAFDLHRETRFDSKREVLALAFHPDGKILASGSNDKTVRLWDTTTFKEERRLFEHGRTVKAVAFSNDGSFLATGSGDAHQIGTGDGTIKLWSFQNGLPQRAIATLVAFAPFRPVLEPEKKMPEPKKKDQPAKKKDEPKQNGPEFRRVAEWAVVDAQGRYDGFHSGDVNWLHFVINNEPVELRQLKDKFYEPRLLAKLLGYNSEPVRTVGVLKDTKLSPQAAIRTFDSKNKQLTIDLTNRDGGMGKVQVLVNGKEVIADARPAKFDPKGGKAELTIDLPKGFFRGKDDKVQIVTWNEKGDLSGRGLVRDVDDAPAAAKPEPKLYAIVVGTSKYANDKLDLRFAAKDAEDFAKTLRIGGERHFGKDNVVMTLLSTTGKPTPEQLPTRENIRKAFERVAQAARPDDVLIVFFAGHGISLTESEYDLYCYMTSDADTMDLKALAEPKFRQARTVSSKDLTEWIKQVPALQQVMILDTCAAGAAGAKLVDVPSGQIRAMEKLKDTTGFHVLMGCSADRVSYESAEIEHGLLTYALLEGMTQSAKKTKVMSLFLHAAERVPEMASKFKGFQHPLISSPGTRTMSAAQLNFILGEFKEGDIALRPEKK